MSVENPVNEVHPATLNWDEKQGQGIPGANPHFGGRMKLGTAVVALVIIAGALVLLTLAPSPTTPENQYVRIVDHSYSSSSFLLGGDSGPANPARLQMALAKYPSKSSVVVATWVLTLKREDQQFVREAWGYIVQPNISALVVANQAQVRVLAGFSAHTPAQRLAALAKQRSFADQSARSTNAIRRTLHVPNND
jgi:hypothetical protein